MNEVVERLKRVLEPYLHDAITAQAREDAARDVLAVLYEPTEAMVQAGCDALKGVPRADFMAAELSSDRQAMAKLKQPIRWRAMIDAALADKP